MRAFFVVIRAKRTTIWFMSVPSTLTATPVTHKRQLISWLETGCKPEHEWRIGTEHEKFLFDLKTLQPLAYEGENGIAVLLDELQAFKWLPVYEGDNVIGLQRGKEAISLEPGGQFELSGAPLPSLHDTAMELYHHLDEVGSVGRVLGFGALGLGHHPTATRDDIPWMPKGRYRIMRNYMPKVGQLGLDMMTRTCTVQVNLDFASERDMAQKLRTSLALQPVVGALFANSPFRDGVPSGDLSTRNRIWQDTDGQRSDPPAFVFQHGFSFERYVDWALSVPMYFVYRDGRYIDVAGSSFTDFMEGRLPQLPGEVATMSDWADHLTTLFPPVRLKRYIEMRGADMACTPELTLALPALWTGLLYDSVALDEAEQLILEWSANDRLRLHMASPRLGLDSPVMGRTLHDIAADLIAIAARGLARRGLKDINGADETLYLKPLQNLLHYRTTQAEALLRQYYDDWNRDISRVFRTCRLV